MCKMLSWRRAKLGNWQYMEHSIDFQRHTMCEAAPVFGLVYLASTHIVVQINDHCMLQQSAIPRQHTRSQSS